MSIVFHLYDDCQLEKKELLLNDQPCKALKKDLIGVCQQSVIYFVFATILHGSDHTCIRLNNITRLLGEGLCRDV